ARADQNAGAIPESVALAVGELEQPDVRMLIPVGLATNDRLAHRDEHQRHRNRERDEQTPQYEHRPTPLHPLTASPYTVSKRWSSFRKVFRVRRDTLGGAISSRGPALESSGGRAGCPPRGARARARTAGAAVGTDAGGIGWRRRLRRTCRHRQVEPA